MLVRPNGDVKIDCIAPFKIGNVLEEDIYIQYGIVLAEMYGNIRESLSM